MDLSSIEEFIKPLVMLGYFAIFGYVYCTKDKVIADDDEFDPSTLGNKIDGKVIKKMAEELQHEKDRVAKLEERIKQYQELPSMSSIMKGSAKPV